MKRKEEEGRIEKEELKRIEKMERNLSNSRKKDNS